MNTKAVATLGVSDFLAHPVWEFLNDDELGESAVRPVAELPVEDLTCRLVGAQVRLANGTAAWALIGNVDVGNPRSTEHFLTIALERGGDWFDLARYHDLTYAERGPVALAQFLGLPRDEVFPISYDIRRFVRGEPATLAGSIPKEPREKLTRAQLIALAVP